MLIHSSPSEGDAVAVEEKKQRNQGAHRSRKEGAGEALILGHSQDQYRQECHPRRHATGNQAGVLPVPLEAQQVGAGQLVNDHSQHAGAGQQEYRRAGSGYEGSPTGCHGTAKDRESVPFSRERNTTVSALTQSFDRASPDRGSNQRDAEGVGGDDSGIGAEVVCGQFPRQHHHQQEGAQTGHKLSNQGGPGSGQPEKLRNALRYHLCPFRRSSPSRASSPKNCRVGGARLSSESTRSKRSFAAAPSSFPLQTQRLIAAATSDRSDQLST